MVINIISIIIFLLVGAAFVFIAGTVAPKLLAPSDPTEEKLKPYECGEVVKGVPWVRFHVRYYVFALLFLIFSVEVAFMFPWAIILRSLGMFGFVEMVLFIVILLAGLIYPWKKGILKWES